MLYSYKVTYNEKSLLELIHNHLSQSGFKIAAAALQQEAGLDTHDSKTHVMASLNGLPSTTTTTTKNTIDLADREVEIKPLSKKVMKINITPHNRGLKTRSQSTTTKTSKSYLRRYNSNSFNYIIRLSLI